jgi:hypothetical protein
MARLVAAVTAGDVRHIGVALIIVSAPLCIFPKDPLAQRARSLSEMTINAKLIIWVQAVEIKIRPIEFVPPTLTPRKSGNMSRIFFGWGFF